jgi:hypothetical protein
MGHTKRQWVEGEHAHASDLNRIEGQYDDAMAEIAARGIIDAHHVHEQSSPAEVWVIAHPLSKRPSVTIVDSAGTVVFGEVEYLDDSTVRVTFRGGFSGKAYLN